MAGIPHKKTEDFCKIIIRKSPKNIIRNNKKPKPDDSVIKSKNGVTDRYIVHNTGFTLLCSYFLFLISLSLFQLY